MPEPETERREPGTIDAPRFAIVFKTHAWDPFIARQFERYSDACGAGDIYIVADETSGSLGPIPHDRVIRTNVAEMLAMGLADAFGKGGLIWWNTDYPNYIAYQQQPDYDFYLFVEYDTRINIDIGTFVAAVAKADADLVALPTRQAKDEWYWTRFHEGCYPREQMQGSLNCISVMSNAAVRMLLARRREMAKAFRAGVLNFWPVNEVFVATETLNAGLSFVSLEDFGDVSAYEWHPPNLEDDLDHDTRAFVHPVLDRKRYIASVLKFEFDLSSYFLPSSNLRRTLARFPARDYVLSMPGAFRRQLTVKIRQRCGAI